MTTPQPTPHHKAQAGWIAMSGSLPRLGGEYPQLAARLLEKMDLAAGVLIVVPTDADPTAIKRFREDIEALLGASPAVEILRQDQPLQLSGVSLLVFAGGDVETWYSSLGREPSERRVLEFLDRGGVLLASDASCAGLGSWRFTPRIPDPVQGLGWLPGGLMLPGIADPGQLQSVRHLLSSEEHSYALGLPDGTALAVGSKGELEVWSRESPKILFGHGWIEP
jgi:hypothetical protein